MLLIQHQQAVFKIRHFLLDPGKGHLLPLNLPLGGLHQPVGTGGGLPDDHLGLALGIPNDLVPQLLGAQNGRPQALFVLPVLLQLAGQNLQLLLQVLVVLGKIPDGGGNRADVIVHLILPVAEGRLAELRVHQIL